VKQVQIFMKKSVKKHAPSPIYTSPNQLAIAGFESPFSTHLDKNNRWVILSKLIPWDELCNTYLKHVGISSTGRRPLNPRIVIGSIIIKHLCNLDDREVVMQISENIYMQYFLGYQSFSIHEPFDASLLVEFRKRLGIEALNAINEQIAVLKTKSDDQDKTQTELSTNNKGKDEQSNDMPQSLPDNKGKLIVDATACPQDIAYPTDLTLLSDAREKAESLIDKLYQASIHKRKPRTYREIARKKYLQTAQKKNKTNKEIRKAVGQQLRFLNRDLKAIDKLLDSYTEIPLSTKYYKNMLVIKTIYLQQKQMYDTHSHSCDNRIVSIHQPHIRPIVRGKAQAKVEFGAKINVSLVDGMSFLDELSWDAFNEGTHLIEYVENYKRRFGNYPAEVLADKIYCTRTNRKWLKENNIKLVAKPLGRPTATASSERVSPGERNPIEGKFGQAKTAYGLNRIRARLKDTSQSMIASIILVLNLVSLARAAALLCLIKTQATSFSAKWTEKLFNLLRLDFFCKLFYRIEIIKSQPLNLIIVS